MPWTATPKTIGYFRVLNKVTLPPNATRIFSTSIALTHTGQTHIVDWLNKPAGARIPGPFPLPEPNRLQIGSGFPREIAKPILKFSKPRPRSEPLYEAYSFAFFWAIDETLRATISEIDPNGFDAALAETRFPNGSRGPDYCLMDLVRFRDCYDVERSTAANPHVMKKSVVNFAFDGSFFRLDALDDAPFFRIPQSIDCLCTAETKRLVEAAGHTRLVFSEVGRAV